jgi:hypothetical protein
MRRRDLDHRAICRPELTPVGRPKNGNHLIFRGEVSILCSVQRGRRQRRAIRGALKHLSWSPDHFNLSLIFVLFFEPIYCSVGPSGRGIPRRVRYAGQMQVHLRLRVFLVVLLGGLVAYRIRCVLGPVLILFRLGRVSGHLYIPGRLDSALPLYHESLLSWLFSSDAWLSVWGYSCTCYQIRSVRA